MVLYYDIESLKKKTSLLPLFLMPSIVLGLVLYKKQREIALNKDIEKISATAKDINSSSSEVDLSLLRRKYLLKAPLTNSDLNYINSHKKYFDDLVRKQGDALFERIASLSFIVENGKLVAADRKPSDEIFEVKIDLSSNYYYTQDIADIKKIEQKAKEMYASSIWSLNKFSYYSKNGVICEKTAIIRNRNPYDQALVFGHNYLCRSNTVVTSNKPIRVFPVITTKKGDYICEMEVIYSEREAANLYTYQLDGGIQDYLSLSQRLEVAIKKGKRLIFGLFGPKKKKYVNTMRLDADLIPGSVNYYIVSPAMKNATLIYVRSSSERSK